MRALNVMNVNRGVGIRIIAAGILAAFFVGCGSKDAGEPTVDTSATAAPSAAADSAAGAARSGVDTSNVSLDSDSTIVHSTDPEQIVDRMKARFDAMGGMDGVNITVTDAGGIVLAGHVPTADRKQTAEDVATVIAGNVSVDNKLVIRP
jgi:osmotically-inducible protein OsmY